MTRATGWCLGVVIGLASLQSYAAAQQVLLRDDFSRADDGWSTGATTDGSSQISTGVLLVRNNTTAPFATVVNHKSTFSDVIVDVEMMLVDGTDDNWQTVYCRRTEAGTYSLGISADGYYLIESRGPAGTGGGPRPGSIAATRHASIRTGKGAVNRVRAECVGSSIRLTVNGTFIGQITDSAYRSGQIAMTVSSVGGEFSTVAFDNLTVSRP